MKRRVFLTATGITGVGISSGIAATELLFSKSPWTVFPGLNAEEVRHMDNFADDLRKNFSAHDADLGWATKIVAPKKIVLQKNRKNGYCLVYKNASGSFIKMEKKGKKVITGLYSEQPVVA